MEPKDTQKQSRYAGLKPFEPGQSGNPGGKPKTSRNRLQGDFMRRLANDFERFGIYAIARARRDDPLGYVRVVASIMPKELEINRPLDEISDEQLDAAILAVRTVLAAQTDGADEGKKAGGKQTKGLPAVSKAV